MVHEISVSQLQTDKCLTTLIRDTDCHLAGTKLHCFVIEERM